MASVLIPTSVPYSAARFLACRFRVGCVCLWGQWDYKSIMICLSRIDTSRNEWCMSLSYKVMCTSCMHMPRGANSRSPKLKSGLVSKQPDPGSEHWTWVLYKSAAHLTTELFLSSPLPGFSDCQYFFILPDSLCQKIHKNMAEFPCWSWNVFFRWLISIAIIFYLERFLYSLWSIMWDGLGHCDTISDWGWATLPEYFR